MTSEPAERPGSRQSGEVTEPDEQLFDPDLIRRATLLVVDDEVLVTSSLKHFFRLEMAIENVVLFNVAVDAAHWAEENRVDLVITDFLMPGMDGLALLAHVKRWHPEAARILLTGYADKANAIRAINEVGLFQYVEKPWDPDRLAATVRAGLDHMALQRTLRETIDALTFEKSERERLRRTLLRAFA